MNIFDVELITARIKLRRLNIDDQLDMFEYTSDPAVTEFLEWDAQTDINQTRDFITQTIIDYSTKQSSYTWGIEYLQNSKLIGVIRIYDFIPVYGRAEISYIMNTNFQGMGIMTEALQKIINFSFVNLKINRLQAKCSTENKGSIRLLQKVGMKQEGRLRKFYAAHGTLHDSFLFAITNDDFNNLIIK